MDEQNKQNINTQTEVGQSQFEKSKQNYSKKKKIFLVFAIALIVLAIISAGLFYYCNNNENKKLNSEDALSLTMKNEVKYPGNMEKDCGAITHEDGAELVRFRTVCYLRAGDLGNALKVLSPDDQERKNMLLSLDASSLNELAYIIENAVLIRATENIKFYNYYDADAEGGIVKFQMSRDLDNSWIIEGW